MGRQVVRGAVGVEGALGHSAPHGEEVRLEAPRVRLQDGVLGHVEGGGVIVLAEHDPLDAADIRLK